jgi:hypothetical protein
LDERLRRAVVVVEGVADGILGEERLDVARAEAMEVDVDRGKPPTLAVLMLTGRPELLYDEDPCESTVLTLAAHTAMWAAVATGASFNANGSGNRYVLDKSLSDTVRDIFGNPFRPVTLDTAWPTPAARTLAQEIYDERAFDRMPELADVLARAGCGNVDILEHCRGPGPHVRGCWVVDLVLGKS